MRALIWKEFRLCWPILLVGCVLLVAPYSILLIDNEYRNHEAYIVEMMCSAALASTAVAILTLTLLGGHAIAGERVDRSVEFLAYLPVSRWSNMISKLVWPAVTPLLVIGVNAAVVYLTVSNSAVSDQGLVSNRFLEIVEQVVVVWALGFSVAGVVSASQSDVCRGLRTDVASRGWLRTVQVLIDLFQFRPSIWRRFSQCYVFLGRPDRRQHLLRGRLCPLSASGGTLRTAVGPGV